VRERDSTGQDVRTIFSDWLFWWLVVIAVGAAVWVVHDVFGWDLAEVARDIAGFIAAWAVTFVMFALVLAGVPLWWRWRRSTHERPPRL
jgi:hypothetical protein